jgi:hypothetical protein
LRYINLVEISFLINSYLDHVDPVAEAVFARTVAGVVAQGRGRGADEWRTWRWRCAAEETATRPRHRGCAWLLAVELPL